MRALVAVISLLAGNALAQSIPCYDMGCYYDREARQEEEKRAREMQLQEAQLDEARHQNTLLQEQNIQMQELEDSLKAEDGTPAETDATQKAPADDSHSMEYRDFD